LVPLGLKRLGLAAESAQWERQLKRPAAVLVSSQLALSLLELLSSQLADLRSALLLRFPQ
jgi:hypothetical protein